MNLAEMIGTMRQSISNAQQLAQERKLLFLADGQPVYACVATRETLQKLISFTRSFPVSTTYYMTDEELMSFILHPHTIGVETDNAFVWFEYIKNAFNFNTGFMFWDRKVAGNEKLLREIYQNVMQMFGLNRFTCYVTDKNRVMWRMLEKVGFQCEGRMRDGFLLQSGEYTDILTYGILRRELVEGQHA